MAMGVRGAIASAVGLVLLVVTASSAVADGMLTGDIPGNDVPGGVALVGWSGGPVDELVAAAEDVACRVRSVWVTTDGRFVGHVVGAPDFVNGEWSSVVGAEIEARPLLIVCGTPGLDSCMASGSVLDYAAEASGTVTPREALDEGVRALSEFPDAVPPEGTFVEVSVSDATADSDATAVFELISHDGAVVGRFTVVNYGRGWLLSGTYVCYFPAAT
jgi:hypothetical protein